MRQAALAVLGVLVLGTGAFGAEGRSAVLLGTVRDEDHDGLPGVRVQVFLDGFPLASARTDSLGTYRVVFPWIPGADSTVLACWTAETGGLVPATALLRESAAARRLGLWDASIPRIAAPAESVHDAVLRTRATAGRGNAAPDTSVSAPGAGADSIPGADAGQDGAGEDGAGQDGAGQENVGRDNKSGAGPGGGPGKEPGRGIEPAVQPGSPRIR